MRDMPPRVAFFPDGFQEIDGVAVVARNYRDFARQQNIPFLLVHAGQEKKLLREGSVTRIQLSRSWLKFPLDRAHEFDLLFLRHARELTGIVKEFRPDFIQITGPSDVGILGALLAHNLNIPLAAFWQTNLPLYAGKRIAKSLSLLPDSVAAPAAQAAEHVSSLLTNRFYKIPSLLFAPNPEIVAGLTRATGKSCRIMGHGVDANVFHPAHRNRKEGPFTLGYVGRLTAEKNVRRLADLEKYLHANVRQKFEFLIVGEGAEESWLRSNLKNAQFTGPLRGEALSCAFANMDLLAFPSETETFGLVVLEALASGVPAVVMASGGPKFTVRHSSTGYVAENMDEFCKFVAALMMNPEILVAMSQKARSYAIENSWHRAFQKIYEAYSEHLGAYPGSFGRRAAAIIN